MRVLHIILLLILFSWNHGFAQGKGDIIIEMTELRNLKGKLSIVLFNSSDGFPEDDKKAYKWQIIDLANSEAVFHFKDLPYGEYAYAILHDEDEDGEMNKNILGIPKEGFGFSNNYRPRVKNPSFEDASFQLKTSNVRHVIEMVYYL
jgi:uncharacterized protein (DUF2141 family)